MILLRHGQTAFNVIFGATRRDPGVRDPRLTDQGRRQAREAAEKLRGESITRLIASPYSRALETAEIVACALDLPVTVEEMVRERTAFSCDVGTIRSKLEAKWRAYGFDHIDEVWWHPEEEHPSIFEDRCHRFRDRMAETPDWGSVAVITHWGVIRALTGHRAANGEHIRIDPTQPSPKAE